jgi:hypothetical protein
VQPAGLMLLNMQRKIDSHVASGGMVKDNPSGSVSLMKIQCFVGQSGLITA